MNNPPAKNEIYGSFSHAWTWLLCSLKTDIISDLINFFNLVISLNAHITIILIEKYLNFFNLCSLSSFKFSNILI